MIQSKRGISSITIGFTQPLNVVAADNLALYHVMGGVKKRRQTVYTKALKIQSLNDNTPNTVTILLHTPYKGSIELAVDGAIENLDGEVSQIEYLEILG